MSNEQEEQPKTWDSLIKCIGQLFDRKRDDRLMQGHRSSNAPSSPKPNLRNPTEGETKTFWRGMNDMQALKSFLQRGGCELAPCSTTMDLETAVRYARKDAPNKKADRNLIFRIVTQSFMQHGGSLKFLSAFPHEEECAHRAPMFSSCFTRAHRCAPIECADLYPPLTFWAQTAEKVEELKWNDGVAYTIVNVQPFFPS